MLEHRLWSPSKGNKKSRFTFLNPKSAIIDNLHTFSTRHQPESNLPGGILSNRGTPHGGCPGGDIEWLNTRVIILGSNSELLSFACCLRPENLSK
jgi:hypothetical protein